MVTTTVTVSLETGLHARPASKFVHLANQFSSEIKVKKGERSANAKSIMNVLSLAITKGTAVEIEAEGTDADEALRQLTNCLLENNES